MEKRFLAASAVLFCVLFAARASRADSIRLYDLDPAAGISNSATVGSFAGANLLAESVGPASFWAFFQEPGQHDRLFTSDQGFGAPIAAHLARGFEPDGLAPNSDDPGPASVPEPASALLLGMSLLGLAVFAKSNRNNSPLPPGNA
jgi:hypothetical protein